MFYQQTFTTNVGIYVNKTKSYLYECIEQAQHGLTVQFNHDYGKCVIMFATLPHKLPI